MKKDIHPKVNTECKVTCVCGNTFTTISTLNSMQVEICSACHPFFTGTQKFVDTEGRIDKFNKKTKTMETKKQAAEEIKTAKKARQAKAEVKVEKQEELKDILKRLKAEEESTTPTTEAKATETTEQ